MKLAAGLNLSDRGCCLVVGFQGLSSQILQMAVQILIILRSKSYWDTEIVWFLIIALLLVQALYNGHRVIKRLLSSLFVMEMTTMVVIFALKFNEVKYGPHCVVIGVPVAVVGFLCVPSRWKPDSFLLCEQWSTYHFWMFAFHSNNGQILHRIAWRLGSGTHLFEFYSTRRLGICPPFQCVLCLILHNPQTNLMI